MAEKIAYVKYNSQKGNGAGIRLYNPADVAYSALRMNTQAGYAAFNLVDPGQGDTGLRINTPRGIKDIKSYLYSQYEDQAKTKTSPGYSLQGSTEQIWVSGDYYWNATPRVFSTPLTRVYQLTGYGEASSSNTSYIGTGDPWAFFVYTTYWWNLSAQTGQYLYPGQNHNTNIFDFYYDRKTFDLGGEYTIYKMTCVPWIVNPGVSFYGSVSIDSYNYRENVLVYH